jgi:tetratricopeptide (TPR) repeat protein
MIAALLFAAQMEMHDHAHGDERLGSVSFPSSCSAAAQPMVTRGVALLHSFWYEESEKTFRAAAAADPRCGIAWWGAAMSNYHPVWPTPYSPAELKRGIEAAQKAKSVGAKTPREQAYIDAIAIFFKDQDARAYEAAMEALVARFPDDDEGRIFYGLALVSHGMSLPTDKTYAYQKKAAAIFNGLLEKHPDHPGIAHYLIHSFDYPALAPLALNAAYAYAKIAPSSPHALHMPSHIFVRLGMWQETIDSNIASARAANDYTAHMHPGLTPYNSLHAYDYLTYAYLQRGEYEKVQKLVDEVSATKELDVENFAGYYGLAAVPARFALERHRWSDAAALTVKPENFPWDRYAYAEAITYFARAVGAARGGNPARAKMDVERLQQLRQKLLGLKNAYWADQVEIQRRAADGWIARAEGRNDEALASLRSAADLEDSMDKSPVTPGAIIPAREMYGDLLLELNQPEKALEAYETALKDSPRRLNGLTGAARAAQLAGDRKKAGTYYAELAKQASAD